MKLSGNDLLISGWQIFFDQGEVDILLIRFAGGQVKPLKGA